MDAKAVLRFVRIAPRKVRVVVDSIKKDTLESALVKLKFTNKTAAPYVLKLLKSAIANASKNNGVDVDKLSIKTMTVESGPILKYARRFMPRAMGRASKINKRTSHVTVVLTEEKLKKKKK